MQTFSRSQPCLVLSDNHIAYQPLTGQKHPGLIGFDISFHWKSFSFHLQDLLFKEYNVLNYFYLIFVADVDMELISSILFVTGTCLHDSLIPWICHWLTDAALSWLECISFYCAVIWCLQMSATWWIHIFRAMSWWNDH